MSFEKDSQLIDCLPLNLPLDTIIALRCNSGVIAIIKDYVKKTFQFITVCKGDMNQHKPKTAKITLGLNLGLYHVLNSCCPSKASHSE